MRLLHVLLVAIAFASIAASTTGNSIAKVQGIPNHRRLLRTDNSAVTPNYSFKDFDSDPSEERGGTAPSLSLFEKSLAQATSLKFSSNLLKTRQMNKWAKNDASLTTVLKTLKLDKLVDDTEKFKAAPNFKYYDEYVMSQIPVWTEKKLTPNNVLARLGLDKSSLQTTNPNFEYYDQFMMAQINGWVWKYEASDDALGMLQLSGLSGALLHSHPNYKYFEKLLAAQMKTWEQYHINPAHVMENLGLSRLSGEALTANPKFKMYDTFAEREVKYWLDKDYGPGIALIGLGLSDLSATTRALHPNFKYFDQFMIGKVNYWARRETNPAKVLKALNLDRLTGSALKNHPNYEYYQKFLVAEEKFRLENWLRFDTPTSTVWNQFGLEKISLSQLKQADGYRVYAKYVRMQFEKFIERAKNGIRVNHRIVKGSKAEEAAKREIWAATGRTKEYTKYVLKQNLKYIESLVGPNFHHRFDFVGETGSRNHVKTFAIVSASTHLI